MKRRLVLLGVAAALAIFGAGIVAGQRFGAAPTPAPPASASASPRLVLGQDAGAKAPKIVFDPDSIQLLPDASLRLDLPPSFDAGTP